MTGIDLNFLWNLIVEIAIIVFLIMSVLYFISVLINNFSYVDFGWSINFSIIVLYLYYKIPELKLPALVLFVMVILWSFRLAFYLIFTRILFKPEEGRYVRLRKSWKNNLYLKFFIFFQFQAITNVILSIPFYQGLYHEENLVWNHYTGIFLFIIGFLGESISDFHLYLFKRKKENKNKTLKTGLWKYSRHPNYFFELLIWFSYGIFNLNLNFGFISFISFFLLLFFILKMTGIPATEEQNISSKGKEYIDYIQNTSPLIPIPPRLYQKLKIKWS